MAASLQVADLNNLLEKLRGMNVEVIEKSNDKLFC